MRGTKEKALDKAVFLVMDLLMSALSGMVAISIATFILNSNGGDIAPIGSWESALLGIALYVLRVGTHQTKVEK